MVTLGFARCTRVPRVHQENHTRVDTRDAGLPRMHIRHAVFVRTRVTYGRRARVQRAWQHYERARVKRHPRRGWLQAMRFSDVREPHASVTCRFRAFAITFAPLHPDTLHHE